MLLVKKDEINSFGDLSQSFDEDLVILSKNDLRKIVDHIEDLEESIFHGGIAPAKISCFQKLIELTE